MNPKPKTPHEIAQEQMCAHEGAQALFRERVKRASKGTAGVGQFPLAVQSLATTNTKLESIRSIDGSNSSSNDESSDDDDIFPASMAGRVPPRLGSLPEQDPGQEAAGARPIVLPPSILTKKRQTLTNLGEEAVEMSQRVAEQVLGQSSSPKRFTARSTSQQQRHESLHWVASAVRARMRLQAVPETKEEGLQKLPTGSKVANMILHGPEDKPKGSSSQLLLSQKGLLNRLGRRFSSTGQLNVPKNPSSSKDPWSSSPNSPQGPAHPTSLDRTSQAKSPFAPFSSKDPWESSPNSPQGPVRPDSPWGPPSPDAAPRGGPPGSSHDHPQLRYEVQRRIHPNVSKSHSSPMIDPWGSSPNSPQGPARPDSPCGPTPPNGSKGTSSSPERTPQPNSPWGPPSPIGLKGNSPPNGLRSPSSPSSAWGPPSPNSSRSLSSAAGSRSLSSPNALRIPSSLASNPTVFGGKGRFPKKQASHSRPGKPATHESVPGQEQDAGNEDLSEPLSAPSCMQAPLPTVFRNAGSPLSPTLREKRTSLSGLPNSSKLGGSSPHLQKQQQLVLVGQSSKEMRSQVSEALSDVLQNV